MHLLEAQTGSVTIETSEFLIDSTRFALGEMTHEEPPDPFCRRQSVAQINPCAICCRIVDFGQTDIALKSIQSLTERWEVALQKRGLQPFSVEEEKKP